MISRWAGLLFALAIPGVRADTLTAPVTATPPVQVVPATPVSRSVQQRMRACNSTADAKKLRAAARETFIKGCMAPRRSHAISRPGSQPKANP
ncbi:MAG TPA: PsiF family protein [Steroidobacteraceae bacterium]